MNRLDNSGLLNDYSVTEMERMAFDRALPRERDFTVTVDTARRAAKEQRDAADHARRESPLARVVPGYHRLP